MAQKIADILNAIKNKEWMKGRSKDHLGQVRCVPDSLYLSYGTAGFRASAKLLPFAVFRVGFLAGVRAMHLNKTIGIMITASHNPMEDNGVKIIDPMGEMLESSWETIATDFVNCSDEKFSNEVSELLMRFPFKESVGNKSSATVLIGFDTRYSSEHLANLAFSGATSANSDCKVLGLLTTPQLHYIVRCQNDPNFGRPLDIGYYKKLHEGLVACFSIELERPKNYVPFMCLDCANGVGGYKISPIKVPDEIFRFELVNTMFQDMLNDNCGADFVKMHRKPPACMSDVREYERCASLDGDADRLVYFYLDAGKRFVLIDGDKIAALFAKFVIERLDKSGLKNELSLCVVQTAYANGNSTKFIRDELGVNVVFTATGIKNLQHEASKYDIGIYFEANGHGTIYFSEHFGEVVRAGLNSCNERKKEDEIRSLLYFSELLNTIVGDGIADWLAVEILLRRYDMNVQQWSRMYDDLPNKQLKLDVEDWFKKTFVLTEDETRCIEPLGLQVEVDEIVSEYESARAFIRPSGTEKIVRIYTEAANEEDVDVILCRLASLLDSLMRQKQKPPTE